MVAVPPIAMPAQTLGADWPPLPNDGVGANLSKTLGAFPTVDQAIAAAKAAGLGPNAYGTAIVGELVLAIDGQGRVFLLARIGGSGNGQRPPLPPRDMQANPPRQ